uniref:LETM1 domain-containing protein n=1 Tax=Panagrellus redivivus TaxID=6233 RepID=A0A7E4ZZT9_PANRE
METPIPTVFDNPKWLELVTSKNIPLGQSWIRKSPHFYKIVKGNHLLRKHFKGNEPARVQWNLRLVEATFTGSSNLESLPEVQQALLDLLKLGHLFKDTLSCSLKSFIRECPALQKYHAVEDVKTLGVEDVFHIWAELNDTVLSDGDIVDRLKLTAEDLRAEPVLVNQKRLFYYFGWDLIFAVIDTAEDGAIPVPTAPVLIAVNGPHFEEIVTKLRRKKTAVINRVIADMVQFTKDNAPTVIHRTRALARQVLANMGELEVPEAPTSSKKVATTRRSAPTTKAKHNVSLPAQPNHRALRASRRSVAVEKMNRSDSSVSDDAPGSSTGRRASKRRSNPSPKNDDDATIGQRAARYAARHSETSGQLADPGLKKSWSTEAKADVKVLSAEKATVSKPVKQENVEEAEHTENPSTIPTIYHNGFKVHLVPTGVPLRNLRFDDDDADIATTSAAGNDPNDTKNPPSQIAGEGAPADLPIKRSISYELVPAQRSEKFWYGEGFSEDGHNFPDYGPITAARRANTRSAGSAPYYKFEEIQKGHPDFDGIRVADPGYTIPESVKVFLDKEKKLLKLVPFIPAFSAPSDWETLDSSTIAPYASLWSDYIKPNLPTLMLLHNLVNPPKHEYYERNSNGAGIEALVPVGGPYEASFPSRLRADVPPDSKSVKLGSIHWPFVRKIEEFLKNHIYSSSITVTDCLKDDQREFRTGTYYVAVGLPEDVQ